MRTITAKLALVFLFTGLLTGELFAQSKPGVAVAAKVMGKTQIKKEGADYKADLKRGTQIHDREWVKTLDDGYLALMFIDDKSLLKLRENSELEIRAVRRAGGMDKTIQMNFGKVKAEISPQRRGEFVIATPTSVASVKGTTFWIISTPDGDQVIGIDGTVTLTNTETGESVQVGSGQTGTSNPDGTMSVEATPEGSVPDDPGTGGAVNQLRIKLENADGDIKEIIIEY